MLRPRKNARHAKPSAVASRALPALAAGGLTTALVAVDGAVLSSAALADAAPTVANFERLAQCESGGRWGINTGNGYYGGLQFSAATWRSVGMSGLPHQHSKATQIAAGQKLQKRSGWGQWPACSRKLGLRGAGTTTTTPATTTHASRSRPAAPAPVVGVPYRGGVTTAHAGQVRADVRSWQARMKQRGWKITVDGRFGPQSASVAVRFAAEKGLANRPGTLSYAVYNGAWRLKVS